VPAIVIPVADLKCRLLHLRHFAKLLAFWQNARKIFFRQFGKMPGKSFLGSLAKCQENLF
jgi:hypothetical protein